MRCQRDECHAWLFVPGGCWVLQGFTPRGLESKPVYRYLSRSDMHRDVSAKMLWPFRLGVL